MAGSSSRDLNFNVGAIDRTARSLEKIALRFEKLERKLDHLDGKKVDVKVNVKTDEAERQVGRFSGLMTTIGSGMIRFITSDARVAVLIIAGLFAALPLAASLAATGIVLGFGAGLAGLGLVGAAQTKKVKDQFAKLKDDLGDELKDISKPFVSTFGVLDAQIRRVFGALGLEGIFKRLAPAVSRFLVDLGDGFVALAPALGPLADSFVEILDLLGPQITAMFADLQVAFADVADVVRDNKDTFALVIGGLIRSIPYVVGFVARLADAFAWMFRNGLMAFSVIAPIIASTVLPALRTLANVVLTVFGVIVTGAAKAFGWVPDVGPKLQQAAAEFGGFKQDVLTALDDAEAKVKEWAEAAGKLGQELQLKADISDLEGKLEQAKQKLKDPTLTAPQKKALKGDISDLEAKLATARAKLAGLNPPTVKQIKGHIADLEAKLESAKAQLRNPLLTKAQIKRLKGHIKDLQEKIRQAKDALAGVRNRTVYIFARWSIPPAPNAGNMLNAALGRRATGGPALAGRSYLVGERGAEVLTMGRGGSGVVTPNRQLSEVGGGGDTIVNVFIGEQQLHDIVRTEVVTSNRDTKRRALAGAGGAR